MGATVELEKVATDVAMQTALMYLRNHGLTASAEALSICVRDLIKIRLPEALRDAQEALDAGMEAMASLTFKASMAQAGIEAARECGVPAGK